MKDADDRRRRPTEGHNDGAGDTVGHDHSEDVHQPGVGRPELELIGLMLKTYKK